MQHETRHRVHQHSLAVGRAAAGASLQINGRLHRHKRQWHELGEAACPGLQRADAQQVSGPVLVAVDMAVHDRDCAAQLGGVRGFHDFEPLAGLDLVGADHRADLIVEDLGRSAGQRAQSSRLQLAQEIGERAAESLGALPDLERREGVDVDVGHRLFDRTANPEVGGSGIFRVDPALHADFGGASIPGLLNPPLDLR